MLTTNRLTRARLSADLRALGLHQDDTVMAHAGMRAIGPLLDGPDALIAAIGDVIGANGTLMVATDWETAYDDELLDENGCVPATWKPHIPPFDPATSRAMRDNGAIAEFVRTTPGARRSANPNCSVAALGARAAWLTDNQPLDYGYGPGSPLAKLAEIQGRVLMIGAPWETMTPLHHAEHLSITISATCTWETMTPLHHAEHLADVPDKRVVRLEVPHRSDSRTIWRMTEEYEGTEAIIAGLPDDYFAQVVADFVATGAGLQGKVGAADALLVDASPILAFAINWLEKFANSRRTP